MLTLPWPVRYILLAPEWPSIDPPVGKSGPGMMPNSSSSEREGFLIIAVKWKEKIY